MTKCLNHDVVDQILIMLFLVYFTSPGPMNCRPCNWVISYQTDSMLIVLTRQVLNSDHGTRTHAVLSIEGINLNYFRNFFEIQQ